MIDRENIEKFAQERHIPVTNDASLCPAAESREAGENTCPGCAADDFPE
jgi:hypothetical protein